MKKYYKVFSIACLFISMICNGQYVIPNTLSWFSLDSTYSPVTFAQNKKLHFPYTILLQNNAAGDTSYFLFSGSDGIRIATDNNTEFIDMSFGTGIMNIEAPTGLHLQGGSSAYGMTFDNNGIYAPLAGSRAFEDAIVSSHNQFLINLIYSGIDNRLGVNVSAATTTTFTLNSNIVGIGASQTYKWNYFVTGY